MTAITRHYDQKSMIKEIVRTSDLMAAIKRLFKFEDVVSFYFSQCENRITQDKSSISTDCCDYAPEVVQLVNFLQTHDLSSKIFIFFSSFSCFFSLLLGYIFLNILTKKIHYVYDMAFFRKNSFLLW